MGTLLSALLTCFSADFTFGADNDPHTTAPSSPAVLYHFLRGAAGLYGKAAAADKQNGTGNEIRDAFSSTIGLNDQDAKAVFGLAVAVDAQFAALDKRARSIIADAEAKAARGETIPPPPDELIALQQQKTQLIDSLAVLVASTCSADGQQAILEYLHSSNTRAVVGTPTQAP